MIQIFSLYLAANESREVAVTGEYFELRNALFPVALIELLDRSGGVVSRLENPEQSDYVKPGRYETIRITNGPTAQTIKHFYGSGDAGSRRTSGLVQVDGTVNVTGDVSVIDGGKNRTLSEVAYLASLSLGATVGERPHCQLWNPAGSGKNIVLESFAVGSAAAQLVVAGVNAVQLIVLTAVAPVNKFAGGAASVAQQRSEWSVASLAATFMYQPTVQANTTFVVNLREPIVLPPGRGFLLVGDTPGTNLNVAFEFYEDPV